MKKAYFIPEETIRQTLPIKWETLLKKLKKRSFANRIPVIFQLPKKLSQDDWMTLYNIHKAYSIFGDSIKNNCQLLNQKGMKLIKIKPNPKFLPFSFKQKLFLTVSLLLTILSFVYIEDFFITLLPVVAGLVPVLSNALIYSDFSWSKTMDIEIKPAKYEDEPMGIRIFKETAGIRLGLLNPLDD
ncbi:MAG: hypothetical protein QXY47_07540, partial [Thermoplasmata archaeon]